MNNIFRHLTDDGLVGDGSNFLITSDGSSTAIPYFAGPPDGRFWHVYRLIMFIEDVGAPTSAKYGAAPALTNGLNLNVKLGSGGASILDLTDGAPIKNNGDWAHHCHDVVLDEPGAGNGIVTARWTFSHSGAPLVLAGNRTEVLELTNNDQLNVLVLHTAIIQGVESDNPHTLNIV